MILGVLAIQSRIFRGMRSSSGLYLGHRSLKMIQARGELQKAFVGR